MGSDPSLHIFVHQWQDAGDQNSFAVVPLGLGHSIETGKFVVEIARGTLALDGICACCRSYLYSSLFLGRPSWAEIQSEGSFKVVSHWVAGIVMPFDNACIVLTFITYFMVTTRLLLYGSVDNERCLQSPVLSNGSCGAKTPFSDTGYDMRRSKTLSKYTSWSVGDSTADPKACACNGIWRPQ
jgi:hypothetical protein